MSDTPQDHVFTTGDYVITDAERATVHTMIRQVDKQWKYRVLFLALSALSGFFAAAIFPGDQIVNPPVWLIVVSILYIVFAVSTGVRMFVQAKNVKKLFAERILPQLGFGEHKIVRFVWSIDEPIPNTSIRNYLLDLQPKNITDPADDNIIQFRIAV